MYARVCVCMCRSAGSAAAYEIGKNRLRQCADYYLYTNIKKKHNEFKKAA